MRFTDTSPSVSIGSRRITLAKKHREISLFELGGARLKDTFENFIILNGMLDSPG